MGRSSPESLCALGGIVHHGYSLSPHEDTQQNGGGVAVDFGGSQPLCIRLHISESVQHPGPGWHTVCTGFGASPKRALQRPEPSRHTSFTRLTQVPAAAKRASRPASDHHRLRTPPYPTPGSDRPVAAADWTVPIPRFQPHQDTPPRLPTQPRQAHSLVGPCSLQPSPRMAAQRTQLQWPSYRPHPAPPPPISDLTRARDRHEYKPDNPSSMKTSEVPTMDTTSMEKPSIP